MAAEKCGVENSMIENGAVENSVIEGEIRLQKKRIFLDDVEIIY